MPPASRHATPGVHNGLRAAVTALALLIIAVSCGEDSDSVDSPFFKNYELVPTTCSGDVPGVDCFQLVTEVFDHPGVSDAYCRVYAFGGPEGTDLGEVARFDGFRIVSGDAPRFDVVIATPRPEGFMRWQAEGHPGPPG